MLHISIAKSSYKTKKLSISDYKFYDPGTDILNCVMGCGNSSKNINNFCKIPSVLAVHFAFKNPSAFFNNWDAIRGKSAEVSEP